MGMSWLHSFVGKELLSTHRNQRKVPYVPQELAQIPWCHLVLMYGCDSGYKKRDQDGLGCAKTSNKEVCHSDKYLSRGMILLY